MKKSKSSPRKLSFLFPTVSVRASAASSFFTIWTSESAFHLNNTTRMEWTAVHKLWEKWAPENVGLSGQPIKQAVLINYDPTGPSRLLSTIAEQEGTKADPIEINEFVRFVKRNKLQTETFLLGPNEYLVTSIHEKWFHARCLNTAKPSGEGIVVMQTGAFLLVATYEGSIGAASRAVAAADQLASQLYKKNL